MTNNSMIILGNGYDVAFKYRTKYSDFYQGSQELHDLADNGNSLCRHIVDNYSDVLWSDLESGLYKYSLDLTKKFGEGNTKQAEIFQFEFNQLRQALFNYLSGLSEEQRDIDSQYPVFGLNIEWLRLEAGYLTFNYSSTTANNVDMNQRRILNHDDSINPDIFIYQHGSIYDMQKGMNIPSSIVLGIDDVEQKVESLHSFLYKTSQNLFDPNITIKKINAASSFLVFGCSFGDSDANYFKAVFNPRNVGKKYIIYYYGNDNLLEIKSNLRKFCGDFFQFTAANKVIFLDIKNLNVRQKTKEAIDSILNEDISAISK